MKETLVISSIRLLKGILVIYLFVHILYKHKIRLKGILVVLKYCIRLLKGILYYISGFSKHKIKLTFENF